MSSDDEEKLVRPKHHHHHHHHKHKDDPGTRVPRMSLGFYKGDGEGMDGRDNHPLHKMNKPKYNTRGAERFMRNHMLGIFGPLLEEGAGVGGEEPEPEVILTTTDYKRKKKEERAVLQAQEKADRAQVKAKEQETEKADKMRKFLENVTKHKVESKLAKEAELAHHHHHHRRSQGSTGQEEETDGEGGPKPAGDGTGAVPGSSGYGPEYGGEGRQQGGLAGAVPFRSLWDEVPGEDPIGMQDDNVYTDVLRTEHLDPDRPRAKTYNVQLQVTPRDLKKVYSTARWDKKKPKKYDVSIAVGPRDWDQIRPASAWDKVPGQETEDEGEGEEPIPNLTPSQIERRRLEQEQIHALNRTESRRADASVLARPLGYKELNLSVSMEAVVLDAKSQVTELDIERELAAQRGIILMDDNILWPSNREFTPEHFELKLESYIDRCWKLDKEWKYSIRHLQQHTTNYRNKYIFEVLFSIPTIRNPVPAATASVFFVVDIGHYAHLDEQIKVHYVLEGTRFPQIPGHLPFQTKWLFGIVADKIRIQKSLDF